MKEKGGAEVEKVVSPAIAGPGFINIRVNRAWTARHIQAMLRDVRALLCTCCTKCERSRVYRPKWVLR